MKVTETCRDISALTDKAQEACRLFLAECQKCGLKVRITETYRSQERQNYLYEQGRTRAGKVVTWTKNSRHKSRRAWDICQDIKGKEYSDSTFFKRCGEIAKKLNITWGGIWKTPDTPHFEIAENWKKPNLKGDEEMTVEERIKFNQLVNSVSELTAEVDELRKNAPRVYHYGKDVPEWANTALFKAMQKGVFKGASADDLNVSEDTLKVLVYFERLGLI